MRFRTVADRDVLRDLETRLARLAPDSARRWGVLSAHEVLGHLGDATPMMLRDRPRLVPVDGTERPLRKAVALWSPLRWPHGLRTSPHYNPHTLGSRPADFARDRARVIDGLERLAAMPADAPLEPAPRLR